MENLTVREQEILKSFRYAVADLLKSEHDDHFLLRWLRARNFNEEKAEAMLRKHMVWRKHNRVDNFLEHYTMPEVFQKYHPGGFLGHDKEGSPVWMLNTGCMDVKGFMNASRRSDFLRYQVWRFETILRDMREQTKKLNRNIEKHIYIMDEEHLAVTHVLNKPVLESLLNVFSIFEANYPETLKRCYVINVPKLFFALYSFIKPLLSEETANKVKIFGTDGWKEALQEDIDPSVLPVHWGGTRTDPVTGDPKCTSLVNYGGTIPEKYYLSKQTRLSEKPGVSFTLIQKRDYEDVAVRVTVPGSEVSWEVETEENDLAIGFFYQKSKEPEELEELIPCTRLETFRLFEEGGFDCTRTGTYIIRLDNTFSWFSAKKVSYRIHIDPNPKAKRS